MHTLNLAWKLYWVYDSNQMGNEVYLFLTNDKKFCWWCYIQIGFQMPMKEVKRFLFVTFVFYSTWRLTGEMFGQMMLHNFLSYQYWGKVSYNITFLFILHLLEILNCTFDTFCRVNIVHWGCVRHFIHFYMYVENLT